MVRRTSSDPLPEIRVRIDTQVVYGRPATHEDLIDTLSQLPLSELLVLLSNLNQYLDQFPVVSDARIQIPLLERLGGKSDASQRIAHAFRTDPRLVFIEPEQVAVLCKFAILYATGTEWPNDWSERLLKALLALNYLLGRETEPQVGNLDDLVRLEVRSIPNQDDRLQSVMVRYQQFFDWSRSERGKQSVNYCDLDTDLKRFTGMTIDEYTAATFCALSLAAKPLSLEDVVFDRCQISLSAIRNGFRLPSNIIEWIESHATSVADLAVQFRSDLPIQYGLVAMFGLMSKPLIRLNDDQLVAPHRGFFENALGSGIFFTLLDGYNGQNEQAAGKKFTRFFGEFFEQYALDIARRFSARSNSRCFGEIEYSGKKSTDIVIFEHTRAVLIEVVAKRFNVTRSVAAMEQSAIDDDLKAMIIDKAVQIDRCIKEFRAGDLRYPDVEQARITKIFPVVLVVQPVAIGHGMRLKIENILEEKRLLQDVYALEVIEVGTLESLEPVLGRDLKLSTVLNRKRVHTRGGRMSLKNHIYHNEAHGLYGTISRRRSDSLLASRHAAWFERATEIVKAWGIGGAPAVPNT
jgi:hypothetical protein